MATTEKKKISVIIPMYNAAAHIAETLAAVSLQAIPEPWRLEIIVVDDASLDQSAQIVKIFPDGRVRLISNSVNSGRAHTRNVGLQAAEGEFCLFLDADCTYAHRHTVGVYIDLFTRGARACFGVVTTEGQGFWPRYQRVNFEKRRHHLNPLDMITTANFGAARDLLVRVGGFDEAYQKYGFEDRDLYFLLQKKLANKDVLILPHIQVVHRDSITIDQVCDKMFEAGYYSAAIFRRKHPQIYRRMTYARFDLTLMPKRLARIGTVMLRGRQWMATWGDKVVNSPLFPFGIKAVVVKSLSALFYMAGTGKCR
jgi:glycosyltransferase involved in cell wall biosynthesis